MTKSYIKKVSFKSFLEETPHFRTYSRRALYDLPQTVHGGRARRAYPKRCHPFLDLYS